MSHKYKKIEVPLSGSIQRNGKKSLIFFVSHFFNYVGMNKFMHEGSAAESHFLDW